MGEKSAKLQQLRPVIFHYKADSRGTLRYGLIAEEVAKVYPELVVRDSVGRIDGVRYDELAPMLLNELQKERANISTQNQKIASLEQQLAGIQAFKRRSSNCSPRMNSSRSDDSPMRINKNERRVEIWSYLTELTIRRVIQSGSTPPMTL